MHIDSTGVRETELYEVKTSAELLDFSVKNIEEVLPGLELRAMSLKKIGDQSFMGIGVSSITQRKSFTQEYMEHAHGATLGWWNHMVETLITLARGLKIPAAAIVTAMEKALERSEGFYFGIGFS